MSSLRIFGGSLRILHPISPLVQSPPGGRRNLRIFDWVSRFLRIYVLFHLKVTKLYVFIAVVACQSQLIDTNLLKITMDDNFGNYHEQ